MRRLHIKYRDDMHHFSHVLEHLFTPAIRVVGMEAIQPIAKGSEIIHAEIIKNIEQSELVLCDMSTLNPNVVFELGIRIAVDKPVCMVRDDMTKEIPFDMNLINYHTYNSSQEPWTLDQEIERLTHHIMTVRNQDKRSGVLVGGSYWVKSRFSRFARWQRVLPGSPGP